MNAVAEALTPVAEEMPAPLIFTDSAADNAQRFRHQLAPAPDLSTHAHASS